MEKFKTQDNIHLKCIKISRGSLKVGQEQINSKRVIIYTKGISEQVEHLSSLVWKQGWFQARETAPSPKLRCFSLGRTDQNYFFPAVSSGPTYINL